MEKYSLIWKKKQQMEKGGWAQKHNKGWKWHYIQYNTEYQSTQTYPDKKTCVSYNCRVQG